MTFREIAIFEWAAQDDPHGAWPWRTLLIAWMLALPVVAIQIAVIVWAMSRG